LFANREGGQDTFGNIGTLRFVVLLFEFPCSNFHFSLYRYGYTDAGKSIVATKTGSSHNPFAQQQQQQNNDKPFFDI
jgi:epsin